MDNLADLLARRAPQEPPEIRAIKDYVKQHFNETVGVLVRERDVVVMVRSSALAGALRVHAHLISQAMQSVMPPESTAKRVIFRVGGTI